MIKNLLSNDRHKLYNLAESFLEHHKILLLFPIILPYPTIVKNKNGDLFNEYKKSISELERVLYDIAENLRGNISDEYSFLSEYRRMIWVKIILPFTFTYNLLANYGFTKLRYSRGWMTPFKWFEEMIKMLLIDKFVYGRFDREIVHYLIYEYKTGGPHKEDIAIPIKLDDKINILIVDTKLWNTDISKLLGTTKEPYTKYGKYIDSATKSEKLKRLEMLIKDKEKESISDYYLIFIQRKKPCIRKTKTMKIKGYRDIIILSITDLPRFDINHF